MRRASPDICEKWTRATGFWAVPFKKLIRVRVGTLNVGTMTGRGRELADLMECCVCRIPGGRGIKRKS